MKMPHLKTHVPSLVLVYAYARPSNLTVTETTQNINKNVL